jgi:ankyrin repeat protein
MKRVLLAVSSIVCLACASASIAANESLARLIQSGDRAAALASIHAGADVNAAQGDGTTPLHWAVYKVDAELVGLLLERGAKADVLNKYGSSPLAEAVKIADAKLVRMLLDAGANVESPNQDGQTALMLAARTGALDVAKLLVERGADVNAKEGWRAQTALMWAADGDFPEIVQLLIAEGADVHARALANDWDAQITSEPRAQYRPTGGLTALLYAARSGCTRCVRSLLEAGADIDQPNPDGVTPLMVAIDNFRYDTARLLLDRGANPHTWDWWGRTPLYVAVDMSTYTSRFGQPRAASETSAIDIIRMLLDADVNPNPQLNMHRPGRGGNSSRFVDDLLTTGATPLLRAAIGHDAEAVRALLEHGAIVDLPNVMGVTPLMGAAGMGISPRDRRLNFDGDVQSRAIATLELLIAAGADVNAKVADITSRTARIARISTMTEREGQTALYGAVKFGWTRVVQYLLDHGAKADVVDALGKSPLNAALGQTGGRDNTVSEEIAAMLRNAAKSGG